MDVTRYFGSFWKSEVSVLTPTIPERAEMLEVCRRSVQDQTFHRWEHLIGLDVGYQGCSTTVNHLAEQAKSDWLFLIADDDRLLAGCLELHMQVRGGADIVYSPPVVDGEPEGPFHGTPPGIPSTALIKTSLWRDLGGYDLGRREQEDLDFFERALAAGAVFHRLREQTWVYVFHGKNKSRAPRTS